MIPFNRPHYGPKTIDYLKESIKSNHIQGDGVFTQKVQNFFEENDFKETEIKPELLKKFSSKGYLIKGITYSLQLASARIPNMNLFKDV